MATECNGSINNFTDKLTTMTLTETKEIKPMINDTNSSNDIDYEAIRKEFGFPLPELYKLVVKFYKDQSGKAFQVTYSERCHLVALSQQVTHGPFDANNTASKTSGFMDVVGRDRRLAWQALGALSPDGARLQFIRSVQQLAPTLGPHVQACWADHLHQLELLQEAQQEQLRLQKEEEHRQQETLKLEEERKQQERTKREIQSALNQQTYTQFRTYAEHQFPGNPEQQGVLIRQLQDQHYQQYMQQVYQQQLQKQQQQLYQQQDEEGGSEDPQPPCDDATQQLIVPDDAAADVAEDDGQQPDEDDATDDSLATAAMWTRRDVKEFKSAVQQEGPNTVLRVGHGETVTVRVPTHQDGTCLFWEFATDAYDIGFGLFFEWTAPEEAGDAAVTVHVTESDEEETDDESDENSDNDPDYRAGPGDVERGRRRSSSNQEKRKTPAVPQSVIIPVYRRDCHEEVYAGSHSYPGTGVYLLKFDNSYSVWRSKTLYYRVYYTQ